MPYVPARLEADTVAAVGPDARLVDVSGDDRGYWRLLRDLWRAGRTFIVVEHDIVPAPIVLDAMRSCDHDWCGSPYWVGTICGVFHGCTRYGAPLIARYPEAVSSIPEQHRHWQSLDSLVIAYLGRRGAAPAFHWPAAEHRNDGRAPFDGVYANCGDCGGPLRFADLRDGPGAERCARCGRVPSYHRPASPAPPQRRRNPLASKMIYVGNGRDYLNGIPAADFDTDDADLIALCVGSGLYVEVAPKKPAKSRTEPAQEASEAPSGGDNQATT